MKQAETKIKSMLTTLETVYPPLSNQEAVWLKGDTDVEAIFRTSDFYMIAGRAEAKFLNIDVDIENFIVRFDFVIGDGFVDTVEIHCLEGPAAIDSGAVNFVVEAGEKLVRIWDRPPSEEGATILDWFTTEKLIWDRSRGHPAVKLFNDHLEAAKYDLLYVGIAKIGDSYDRLINKGHQARMEILANEPQRLPGARITDETYLFLFRVVPLVAISYEMDHDFENENFGDEYEQKRVVADAEKAFVNLLQPEYNVVRFKNYPKGADGMSEAGFVRYGYVMAEPFSFNTAHGKISGGRDPTTGMFTNSADCIFVEDDTVKLYLSGVDFPAE